MAEILINELLKSILPFRTRLRYLQRLFLFLFLDRSPTRSDHRGFKEERVYG